MPVKPGLRAEVVLRVSDDDSAIAYRSGVVPVLATPRIIALCEEAAIAAVDDEIEPNATTVSMKVQIDHLAPTPVGGEVVAEATVEKVSGRRIVFTVSVNDERGLVAAGRLTRVVVDFERFMERIR